MSLIQRLQEKLALDSYQSVHSSVYRSSRLYLPPSQLSGGLILPILQSDNACVCQFISLPVRPSVCLSICLSVSVGMSISQSVCPSICSSVCLSDCLSVRLSVCLSVVLSVRPSVCTFVSRSICLPPVSHATPTLWVCLTFCLQNFFLNVSLLYCLRVSPCNSPDLCPSLKSAVNFPMNLSLTQD